MSLLAEVAASLGMEETGDTLYPLLLPWSNLNAVDLAEGMRGSVSRYLALLAEMLGRFGDAERHFEDALAMNDRMGAHPWLALTQEDHGRMLISRGEDVRGRALVEQALATYRELGMHGPFRRAEAFAAAGI
jgi:hypothetical protein